jgi:hypothetical protein
MKEGTTLGARVQSAIQRAAVLNLRKTPMPTGITAAK